MTLPESQFAARSSTVSDSKGRTVSLECGHPIGCYGKALDGVGCGWCADLADMKILADNLSIVYGHFSRGAISKPMTLPEEVIRVATDAEYEEFREYILDETKELRAAIVYVVGIYLEFYQDESRVSDLEVALADFNRRFPEKNKCPTAR